MNSVICCLRLQRRYSMKCQISPLDVARNAHSVTIYRSFPRILVFLHTLKVKVHLLRECHALRNDLRNEYTRLLSYVHFVLCFTMKCNIRSTDITKMFLPYRLVQKRQLPINGLTQFLISFRITTSG